MADGRVESDFSAKRLDDKLITSGTSECQCCLNMRRNLKEMREELSSAKLIINLLQTEGNVVTTIDTATNQEMYDDPRNNNANEWKLVLANRNRLNRPTPVQQSQPQLIPTIINRYTVLGNLKNHSRINSGSMLIPYLLPKKERIE
jgi:hypothetical protein